MAFVSQGTTVTWGGATLGEIVSVSVSGISADVVDVTPRTSTARAKVFSPADGDPGSVSVRARATAAMSSTNVGLTAALSIGGAGVSWSDAHAIFQTLEWSASTGELQEFTATFKLGGR